MCELSDKTVKATRDRVIAFLLFLTSQECFAALQRFVAPEKVAYELCRIWFDDIYLPGTRYLNALKGDFSKTKAEAFEECFDVEELIELERFNHFFELRIDMLTATHRATTAFPQNDAWKHLCKHALYVAEAMEPDHRARQQLLETRVRESLMQRGRLPDSTQWQALIAPPQNPDPTIP